MSTVKLTTKKGTNAVKKLRVKKLRSGLPFMINAKELASDRCYLEFPNGSIKLVTTIRLNNDFDVIRELTSVEANDLRVRFHFSSVK